MYELIRLVPGRQLLVEQLPAALTSLLIAETFYKFHSFTLECVAFLATWWVVDALLQGSAALLGGARTPTPLRQRGRRAPAGDDHAGDR